MGCTEQSRDLTELLKCDQRRMWEKAVVDANREEARTDYQQEFATWEQSIEDGLESS